MWMVRVELIRAYHRVYHGLFISSCPVKIKEFRVAYFTKYITKLDEKII